MMVVSSDRREDRRTRTSALVSSPHVRTAEDLFYQALGDRIRLARLARKMSQHKVAGLVDIPRTSLIAIERGRQRLTVYTLVRLADIFGLQVEELLRVTDRPSRAETAALPDSAPDSVRDFVTSVTDAAQRARGG